MAVSEADGRIANCDRHTLRWLASCIKDTSLDSRGRRWPHQDHEILECIASFQMQERGIGGIKDVRVVDRHFHGSTSDRWSVLRTERHDGGHSSSTKLKKPIGPSHLGGGHLAGFSASTRALRRDEPVLSWREDTQDVLTRLRSNNTKKSLVVGFYPGPRKGGEATLAAKHAELHQYDWSAANWSPDLIDDTSGNLCSQPQLDDYSVKSLGRRERDWRTGSSRSGLAIFARNVGRSRRSKSESSSRKPHELKSAVRICSNRQLVGGPCQFNDRATDWSNGVSVSRNHQTRHDALINLEATILIERCVGGDACRDKSDKPGSECHLRDLTVTCWTSLARTVNRSDWLLHCWSFS
jgi:hypothetical protein